MLSLYYRDLMGKNEKHEIKNYLIVDSYMVDKVLNKI